MKKAPREFIFTQKYNQFTIIFLFSLLLGCGGGGSETKTPIPPEQEQEQEQEQETIDTSGLYFQNTTQALGLVHDWNLLDLPLLSQFDLSTDPLVESGINTSGGIAIGDYNQDGLIDLYITSGNASASKLYQQQIDGTYIDVAEQAGLQLMGVYSGPSFADTDNDGDLDLFVGGMGYTVSKFFINQGDGTFVEGIAPDISREFSISSSFGDINNDGFLDLALSHYGSTVNIDPEILWLNKQNNLFESISIPSGITESQEKEFVGESILNYDFTPSFADINNDGKLDLLLASDFSNSSYYINEDGENFTNSTVNMNINKDDLHGMGATLADIDNDGDLDWFITSIVTFDGTSGSIGASGNKLLQNNGDGTFTDISYQSNIYNGGWGWASCIADFNNDGLLDLFNTNGWFSSSTAEGRFESTDNDTIKLFLATESGVFTENNIEIGLIEKGQGRAAVCFDRDNDGDIDILLSNHDKDINSLVFYENSSQLNNYLKIDLKAFGKNIFAIGARVYVKDQFREQMREVNINSNFTSQNPSQLHFGLGEVTKVDQIKIIWPDGEIQLLTDIEANQSLLIEQK
jgi:hypothetical protein